MSETFLFIADYSNYRIMKRLASDLSYVSQYGTQGSGNDNLSNPYSTTTDGTYIYISDYGNHRIVKRLLSDNSFVSKIGSQGAGNDQFYFPQGLANDGTYLYVVDGYNHRIVKRLLSDLSYVAQVGSIGYTFTLGEGYNNFYYPEGICFDGTYLYIADQANNRIVKRLASDLSYVSQVGTKWGMAGSGNDTFDSPVMVDCDSTYLYVSDVDNHRVKKHLLADLSYVAQVGGYGAGDNQFYRPYGLGNDGTYLYVMDSFNHRIVKRLLSDLSYVAQVGSIGSGDDQFYYAKGLSVYVFTPPVEPPTSFEESRERLQGRGYISVFIDQLTGADKIFETINEAVGSYLYSGYDGKYRYKVFEVERGEDSLQFTDADIFSFTQSIDATEVFSNVRAEFAYRTLQDYSQVYLFEKKESQYLQNSPIPVSMEKRLPFSERSDAIFWSQRALQMYGERQVLSRATVTAKGWTLEPGMFVQMTYTRQAINAVFEVLDVKRDLSTSKVDLVLGDQHGMLGGETAGGGTTVDPGFWTEDAPVFPSALGGGAASPWDPAWSAEQKLWARQNMGFWCDENGFADPTDAESRLPSTWV